MKLLINADDLGYTPAINQTIFDLHNHNRLFSASLLVNMPYSQEAVSQLPSYPGLDIGIHLNLTKGDPVLPAEQVPSLVSPTGEFWDTKSFYLRALTGRIALPEVQAELRAQIERLLDFGIQPTHLDSHSHWHVMPYLRKLISWLANRYQIAGVRQAGLVRTLIPSKLWLAAVPMQTQPQTTFRSPDYLLSLHQWMETDGNPLNLFSSSRLQRLVGRPNIILELVTHPGALVDPDFPPDTLLTHQRQWETELLHSPCFDAWKVGFSAEIVSYRTI